MTVDEEELIGVLQEYFANVLKQKKKVIDHVVNEFQRVYKAKDENLEYEKELTSQLSKLQKTRQKYMDMYTDDLISREELNEKIGGMRKEIERLENELKMVSYHLTKGEQLEAILNNTFKTIEDITDVHQMTNVQLKKLIQKIEVDKDGNVDIYLRLLGDLGLDETILIEDAPNSEDTAHETNIYKTVPNSNDQTDGKDRFAIGHQQMVAVWITDKVAHIFGKKENSIENLKFPGFLKMFEDNITATSTLMLVFFGTIMAILGEDFMRQIDSGFAETTAFPVYILIQSLYFTVYLQILNMGVKLFVGELTASFKGISDKLLPGAVPAVDCAVAFNYAPGNAVTIGFLCGMVGQVIAILGLIVFHSPVIIIMGFTTVFFDNAIIAIFANKRGGVKAAMIIPFICGLIQVLLGAVTVWLVELVPYGGWHGTTDFSTVWLGISALLKCLGLPGAIIAIILMLLVPQIQYAKSDKENYF